MQDAETPSSPPPAANVQTRRRRSRSPPCRKPGALSLGTANPALHQPPPHRTNTHSNRDHTTKTKPQRAHTNGESANAHAHPSPPLLLLLLRARRPLSPPPSTALRAHIRGASATAQRAFRGCDTPPLPLRAARARERESPLQNTESDRQSRWRSSSAPRRSGSVSRSCTMGGGCVAQSRRVPPHPSGSPKRERSRSRRRATPNPPNKSQDNRASAWNGATALGIAVGGASEDLRYLKSISLQMWLFGYELPGTSPGFLLARARRRRRRRSFARTLPAHATSPPPPLLPSSTDTHTQTHTRTDTIMLMTDKEMHVLSSAKKSE